MPPLTLENSSALVGGGNSRTGKKEENMQQLQTKTVRVLRNFYYQAKAIEKGTVVTLPKVFAIEMIAANKAEAADGEPESTPKTGAKQPEKKAG